MNWNVFLSESFDREKLIIRSIVVRSWVGEGAEPGLSPALWIALDAAHANSEILLIES
jgi:hypothetical protein